MLTKEQYDSLKQKQQTFDAWIDTIRDKKSGWASYKITEDIPAHIKPFQVTNEERSAIEIFEFCTNPPSKYFAYIKENPNGFTGLGSRHMLTTWTGEYLGDVVFGSKYRDNFGGKRICIQVEAINGKRYFGTYYTSSGNYCRIQQFKSKPEPRYVKLPDGGIAFEPDLKQSK